MQTKNIVPNIEKKINNLIEQLVDQEWALCDALFSEHEFEELLNNLLALDLNQKFNPAHIGTQGDKKRIDEIRNDRTYWIDANTQDPAQKIYTHFLNQLQNALNQQLYLGIQRLEIHYAIYERGGFYKKHLDQAKNSDARIVSCLYYLNPNWTPKDGGELILYKPEDENQVMQTIHPIGNRFACFLSDRIQHEVSPSQIQRKSIAGWLRRDI